MDDIFTTIECWYDSEALLEIGWFPLWSLSAQQNCLTDLLNDLLERWLIVWYAWMENKWPSSSSLGKVKKRFSNLTRRIYKIVDYTDSVSFKIINACWSPINFNSVSLNGFKPGATKEIWAKLVLWDFNNEIIINFYKCSFVDHQCQ